MSDVFFSYCSEDRSRVKLVHDAIEDVGFDVFWDQQVPAGTDWDSWIKTELKRARSAIVFWTAVSAESANVRQEATIANDDGKLIQIMLEPLSAGQFPMGLYTKQALDLSGWDGSPEHEGWIKLWRELEMKVAPKWVSRRLLSLETSIKTEQMRRGMAEAREAALEAKFADEVASHKATRLERDAAQLAAERAEQAVEELAESKNLTDTVLPATERRLREAQEAQAKAEAALAMRSAVVPPWMRWGACAGLVIMALAGFALGRSDWLPSQERLRLVAANIQLKSDLKSEEQQRKSSETRLAEFERESERLQRDLKTARGLADMNWLDAAIALREVRDRQATEKGEAESNKSKQITQTK